MRRVHLVVVVAALMAGCSRNVEVEKVLAIADVRTGWYDAGLVEGQKNKLVPSVSFRLRNTSPEPVDSVQLNAVFRRIGEDGSWGDHFVRAIGRDGLAAGATGELIVLRSSLGYTGTQPRLDMLRNREFVDARVEIFGKHGSRAWAKMGDYVIARELLTE